MELDKYACYVIADGIDDQVDGMSAKLAVDTIISAFTEAPSMRKGALRRYLRSANKALLTADSKMRLKASVTVVVTNYVKMRYGQAGNTRFRLYRDGFLRAQSRDQSLSMDLVKAEKSWSRISLPSTRSAITSTAISGRTRTSARLSPRN